MTLWQFSMSLKNLSNIILETIKIDQIFAKFELQLTHQARFTKLSNTEKFQ